MSQTNLTDNLVSDLTMSLLVEAGSEELVERLQFGIIPSTTDISSWHRLQDPLNETLEFSCLVGLARGDKELIQLSIERYKRRTKTYRTAAYLCILRACLPEAITEGNDAEFSLFDSFIDEAQEYFDSNYQNEKDIPMTSQDIVLHRLLLSEGAREDESSTNLLLLASHLLYDAVTDSVDMTGNEDNIRDAVFSKDFMTLVKLSQILSERLPEITQTGNIEKMFEAAQTFIMLKSNFINVITYPINKSKIGKPELADEFSALKSTIESVLPFIDKSDRRQMGRLYEMVWAYDAIALKIATNDKHTSVVPAHIAHDAPIGGKHKRKRNIDIRLIGAGDNVLRIQLKSRLSNRIKARKSKHPDVYISEKGEDFDESWFDEMPRHLALLEKAVRKGDHRLAQKIILPTVADSFTKFHELETTTTHVGAGIIAFTNGNPEFAKHLKLMTQNKQSNTKIPTLNREQRRQKAKTSRRIC